MTLSDGTEIMHEVTDARGDPELPLSPSDMIDKAKGLLEFGEYDQPDRLIDDIMSMPGSGQVPDLSGILVN